MTTNLKKLLIKQASNTLFDTEGDSNHDAGVYYMQGLECLFPLIAKAARADGVSALIIMKMLVSAAFEIFSDPAARPGEGRDIGKLVVNEAERLYKILYPSQAEIEELKREAAAFRAARSRH